MRHAVNLSYEELRNKILSYIEDDDERERYSKEGGIPLYGIQLPVMVEKDLTVDFDFENCEYEQKESYMDYPCGFETLPNGVNVLFINAGGDWEAPVCFVLYYDGKSIRAYVPRKGNLWNRTRLCALGSEYEDDPEGEMVRALREIIAELEPNRRTQLESLDDEALLNLDLELLTSEEEIRNEVMENIVLA